ncbi:MAG: toxin-activating lysine-acyltransferase [Rhodospirillales bacterium]|nr:toxin-activating lysine-acyltransferase [Rhodospirillales bacterium]
MPRSPAAPAPAPAPTRPPATQARPQAAPARPPAAQAAPPPAPGGGPNRSELLGDIAWLMTQSVAHKHLFISDIEWLVMPPILTRQFRLVRQGAQPVAYVSWAMLNAKLEARFVAGNTRLRPADWKSGDRAWIVDIVSPFGPSDQLLTRIKAELFPMQPLRVLRRAPDGSGFLAAEIGR